MSSAERTADATAVWSHTATLAPEPISAARARAFVVDRLIEHEIFSLVDPIRLVTSELVTNAILHARTSFTVTLALTSRGVLLTVTDESVRAPLPTPFDAMNAGGRGLVLVDLLSAGSGVLIDERAGSKSVWASFLVDEQESQEVAEPLSPTSRLAQGMETDVEGGVAS
jgi:hypothetical protein